MIVLPETVVPVAVPETRTPCTFVTRRPSSVVPSVMPLTSTSEESVTCTAAPLVKPATVMLATVAALAPLPLNSKPFTTDVEVTALPDRVWVIREPSTVIRGRVTAGLPDGL